MNSARYDCLGVRGTSRSTVASATEEMQTWLVTDQFSFYTNMKKTELSEKIKHQKELQITTWTSFTIQKS